MLARAAAGEVLGIAGTAAAAAWEVVVGTVVGAGIAMCVVVGSIGAEAEAISKTTTAAPMAINHLSTAARVSSLVRRSVRLNSFNQKY